MDIQTRSAKITSSGEDGLFRLQFSSETPVKRGGFFEVLVHSNPNNVDLTRMAGGAILVDHNQSVEKMVAVSERAWIEDGVGLCEIRFGTSELAQQVRADVEAGIVNSISVGYSIEEYEENERDGLIEMLVTKWTVREISIVAVPADPTCKFIRSSEEIRATSVDDEAWEQALYKFNRTKEIERTNTMRSLAQSAPWDVSDILERSLEDGATVEEFRERVFEMANNQPKVKAPAFHPYKREEEQQYSISKVIRSLSGDRSVDIGKEIEMSRDLELQGYRSSGQGIIVPVSALVTRNFAAADSGADLIGTTHMADKFIDALRPHSVAVQLGATMLTGLKGNVSIPKQSASATAEWISLDGVNSITESEPTISNLPLTMKSLAALTPITHQLLKQSSPSAEQLVKNDLLKLIATSLDKAMINGSGTGSEPLGIANTPGVNTVTASDTTGKIPTYAEVVDLFGQVAIANADMGNMGYLASPDIATSLMRAVVDAGSGQMVWKLAGGNTGEVAGHKAMYSGAAPAMTTMFGNWSDVIIGTWGTVELAVDPNYKFAQGGIAVRCIHDCDIGVRNAQSFSVLV